MGYCLVLPAEAVAAALTICREQGHQAWELGRIAAGEQPLQGLPY